VCKFSQGRTCLYVTCHLISHVLSRPTCFHTNLSSTRRAHARVHTLKDWCLHACWLTKTCLCVTFNISHRGFHLWPTRARCWGAASCSSSCLANPNPNPSPNPNPNPNLTLVVFDLTLFYNPRPNPNTKSNSKSNPNPSSHRFVWRDMAFTLKMYHSPFAPARVTRSRKTKHTHKHYS